ncbi:hypothetical protein KCP70_16900 [Salmonella enterica subsp. enterica]|nr:hypothetical protein KCP70_16900 [Salmonella enterica subsp. enterica]
MLKNTDNRIRNEMRVNPAFLLPPCSGIRCWRWRKNHSGRRIRPITTLSRWPRMMLDEACRATGDPETPYRFTRGIWRLQLRMSRRPGARARAS